MERKLLIWSFGNADIYFDSQLIEHYNDWELSNISFVEKIQIILNNYDKYSKKLNFPMINSFLEQQEKWKFDFVGIFTKQSNKYSITDTYLIYDLLQLYLKDRDFGDDKQIVLYPKKKQIVLDDAFDEERIFNILQLDFTQIKEEISLVWYKEVLLNITGGTKIMTLLLASVVKDIFDSDEIKIYYGLWDKNTDKTKFITVNKFITNV